MWECFSDRVNPGTTMTIMDHQKLCSQADPAIASLIKDLRTSGLLKETLIIVGGEFGRTPAAEVSGLVKVQNGRDHNSLGFSTVLIGGGVGGGTAYGATDDFGYRAVEKPVHVHDLMRRFCICWDLIILA